MNEILEKLKQNISGVNAVSLTSIDGLLITAILPNKQWEEKIAAISASIIHTSATSTSELEQTGLKQIIVKNEDGHIIVTQIGNDAILTVVANKTAKLGMILLEIEEVIQKLVTHLVT